jgi:hypothetical protein
MIRVLLCSVGLLFLMSSWTHGQLLFGWEYPRTLAAEAFLLTVDGPGGHLTWRTAPSPPGACLGDGNPDTYCTNLPQCPPAGTVQFEVTAVVNGEPSGPSATRLPCQVTKQAPCTVQCETPAGVPQSRGSGSVAEVPTTGEPAQVFETEKGSAVVDRVEVPTKETATLPKIDAMPALPLFQPAASQAPT